MNKRTVIENNIIVVGNQLQHANGGSFSSFIFGNIDSLKNAVSYCGMPKRVVKMVQDEFTGYIWR